MLEIQPPDGANVPQPRIECDAIGCRDLADYRLVGHWLGDERIPLYVCLVHMVWGIKELRALHIEGRAPLGVYEFPLGHLA